MSNERTKSGSPESSVGLAIAPVRRALAVIIHVAAGMVMLFVAWRASALVGLLARLGQKGRPQLPAKRSNPWIT